MIRREGERMFVTGAVTLQGVAALLDQGKAQLADGVRTVDLSEVSTLDSSALAMLLAWLRDARARNQELAFAGFPEGLSAIARLYGVAEFLAVVQPQVSIPDVSSTHH